MNMLNRSQEYVIKRFYLLQQMHKQGLNDDCSKVLFHAIILSKVLYALSAWGGYISDDNIGCVNKLLRKAKCCSFIDTVLTFPELMEQSDEQFSCFPITVYTICLKRQLYVPKCCCDPEVIVLLYLGINVTLPGRHF